jgi:hypothetical protein
VNHFKEEISKIKTMMGLITEDVTPAQVHKAADKAGMEWDDNKEFMDFSKKITGKRHIDDMSSELREKLIQAIQDDETQTKEITISFDIDWNKNLRKVKQKITLAMSPTSIGLFGLGEDIEKYSGLSQKDAEAYKEIPTDAYVYGLCNTMNGSKDIFFWTNGTRLAGASKKVGLWPACFEQMSHECIHLTRLIISKHILGKDWTEKDWPSIGDNSKKHLIDEEAWTTSTGLVVEQITDSFLEMAETYIPALTKKVRDLK